MIVPLNSSSAPSVNTAYVSQTAFTTNVSQTPIGPATNPVTCDACDQGLWAAATANYAETGAPAGGVFDATAPAAQSGAPQAAAVSASAQLAQLGASIARHIVEVNPFTVGSPI